MKRALAVALLCAVPFVSMAEDDEAMLVPLKRLTMDTAMTIAKGAVDACRKEGIQIAVTVVDRNGLVQAVLRDTIASPITLKISHQKAYTAANFNAATSAMSDRAGTPIGRVEGLVMSAGGLPIQAGGALLGAVGVSGAPSGVTDEACAQAGIDAVIDDLEMSM
ncbi:MAG: heme-binding protein [Candidatus Sedimenticola sp. (ex Thyasira tokunagai)]